MVAPALGSPRLTRYVASLVVAASALAVVLLAMGWRIDAPWPTAALAVTAAVSERWRVPLTSTTVLSVYLLPTVLAAVVLGPLEAGCVAASAMLGDSELFQRGSGRQPLLKWLTYTSIGFIVGAVAGIASQAADDLIGSATGSIVIATFVAMAVAESLDFLFAVSTAMVRGRTFTQMSRWIGPIALTSVLVYSPIVVVLAIAYSDLSEWTLPLFLVPALAVQRLYALYQRERSLTDELTRANETLSRANLSFASALVLTLDARDRYTAGHSAAVAIYSRDIAERMGLTSEEQERAYVAGLVHDIGKIGLPAALLDKAGPLTLEERRAMQKHSAIGERILREVDDYTGIAAIVRHHHERMDGEGYPDGLAADEIPTLSRIIAVADAYNAMTSDRPYRDAMPSRVARLRLAQAVESQFDTAVVAAFEAILTGASEEYRTARRADFLALTSYVSDDDESSREDAAA